MRIEPAVAPAGARGTGGRDRGPRGTGPRGDGYRGSGPRAAGSRDLVQRQYAPRPAPKRDFVPREANPRAEGEASARKAYVKPVREWNPIDGAAEGASPRPAKPFNPNKKPSFDKPSGLGPKPVFEKKASYGKRATPGEGKPFFPKKPKSKKGKPNG